MTEATEKDLKDLGAPDGASLCEVCGLQIDPEGGIPPGTCQGWNDAVGHWRLGYERLREELEAAEATFEDEEAAHMETIKMLHIQRLASAEPPAGPSVSDLTSSLTREREENQRLRAAIAASPHPFRCQSLISIGGNRLACDCWKAMALTGGATAPSSTDDLFALYDRLIDSVKAEAENYEQFPDEVDLSSRMTLLAMQHRDFLVRWMKREPQGSPSTPPKDTE